jgi:hypothetical protein
MHWAAIDTSKKLLSVTDLHDRYLRKHDSATRLSPTATKTTRLITFQIVLHTHLSTAWRTIYCVMNGMEYTSQGIYEAGLAILDHIHGSIGNLPNLTRHMDSSRNCSG